MSSSVRSENLRDIWRLLDESGNDVDNEPGLKVQGVQAPVVKATGIPTSIKKQAQRDTPTRPSAPVRADSATTTATASSRFKENRLPSTTRATPVSAGPSGALSARLSSKSPKPKIRNYNIKS